MVINDFDIFRASFRPPEAQSKTPAGQFLGIPTLERDDHDLIVTHRVNNVKRQYRKMVQLRSAKREGLRAGLEARSAEKTVTVEPLVTPSSMKLTENLRVLLRYP